MGDDQVKKVAKAVDEVTLSHTQLANLDMPAITMVFKVGNVAWLDSKKSGDKICFMALPNFAWQIPQTGPLKTTFVERGFPVNNEHRLKDMAGIS